MYDEFPTGVLVAWGGIGAAYGATCVWMGIRLFNHRERGVKWTSVALAVIPMLYVISSGPMTMLSFHFHLTLTSPMLPNSPPTVGATAELDIGNWFAIAYAPLLLAADEAPGDFIFQYWMLFPHQRTVVDP